MHHIAGWNPPVGSFNPRPAVRPGDASEFRATSAAAASFNPRPAVRPGDARWIDDH